MRNYTQNFFLLISLVISIIIATLIYDKINFTPSIKISENFPQSSYVLNNYHYLNEILRYFIFIFFPSITYIFFLVKNKNFQIPTLKKDLNLNNNKKEQSESNLALLFLIFLIFFINFYLYIFPLTKGYWDGLHYGQYLTPGENYFHFKTFWKDTFITMGWGYEFLIPILSNKIFNSNTIGNVFSVRIILTLLTQLILILFAYNFSFKQKLPKNLKNLIFLILTLGIFILANFYQGIFVFREIPLIIFLICIWFFVNHKNIGFSLIVLGLFSCLSVIWGLDRGAYFNASLLLFIFFLLINKQFKNFFLVSLYIFIGWAMFYLIVGGVEFNHFLNNSQYTYLNTEHINGTIHPSPFSSDADSSRATKNLLLIALSAILTLKFCFNKNSNLSLSNKVFFIFLFFLALITYKTGLGLSDRAHMRVGLAFCLFYFVLLFSIQLGLFFKGQNFLITRTNILNSFLVFFLIGMVCFYLFKRGGIINPNKFKIFELSKLENDLFLSKEDINKYNALRNEFKDDECIQSLVFDASIPYMISKPTCNKFYYPFSIAGPDIQKEYINLLIELKTNRVLIRKNYDFGKKLNLFNYRKKLKLIFQFLDREYKIDKEIGEYLILRKSS